MSVIRASRSDQMVTRLLSQVNSSRIVAHLQASHQGHDHRLMRARHPGQEVLAEWSDTLITRPRAPRRAPRPARGDRPRSRTGLLIALVP